MKLFSCLVFLFTLCSALADDFTLSSKSKFRVEGSVYRMYLPIKEPVRLTSECIRKILGRLNAFDWNISDKRKNYFSSSYLSILNENGIVVLSIPADGVVCYKDSFYETNDRGSEVVEIAKIIRDEGLLKLISFDESNQKE